jgi:hypothetical protein
VASSAAKADCWLNQGSVVVDNGGRDFFDTMLYVGAPDIGPYEAP